MAKKIFTGTSVQLISDLTLQLAKESDVPQVFCEEDGVTYTKDAGMPNGWRAGVLSFSSPLSRSGNTVSIAVGSGANQVAAGNHAHPNATTENAGFMSAADKNKLDALAARNTYFSGGTGQTGAILLAGQSVAVPITYDAPLPSLAGKTANDSRVVALITSGLNVNLLGKLDVKVTSRSLTGCVVTLTNGGLISLTAGVVVEAMAIITG